MLEERKEKGFMEANVERRGDTEAGAATAKFGLREAFCAAILAGVFGVVGGGVLLTLGSAALLTTKPKLDAGGAVYTIASGDEIALLLWGKLVVESLRCGPVCCWLLTRHDRDTSSRCPSLTRCAW